MPQTHNDQGLDVRKHTRNRFENVRVWTNDGAGRLWWIIWRIQQRWQRRWLWLESNASAGSRVRVEARRKDLAGARQRDDSRAESSDAELQARDAERGVRARESAGETMNTLLLSLVLDDDDGIEALTCKNLAGLDWIRCGSGLMSDTARYIREDTEQFRVAESVSQRVANNTKDSDRIITSV